MLCIFKFFGNGSICAIHGNSNYQVTQLIRFPACPMNHHQSSEHHGGGLRWKMNCHLPFRHFHGPLAGAVLGGGTRCTFASPASPLPLSGPPDYQVEATAAEDKAEPQWEREGAGLPTARRPCCAGNTEGMSPPQPLPSVVLPGTLPPPCGQSLSG